MLAAITVISSGALRVPGDLLHDPDLWWHLADARILTTTHHFIRTEPYSFTVAGNRWVNQEWASELVYWIGYSTVGLRGLYVATFLVLFSNVLLIYFRSLWRSGHAGAAFWATGIGYFLMTVNAGPRTIAVAYILMSLEMAILEAAERGSLRWLWFLPLLFCIWVNSHGSWLIGLGLFVLYILCGWFPFRKGTFEQAGFSREARTKLLSVLGVSVAALIVNPYGWRLVWNPFDMMMYQKLNIHNVLEWQPLNLEMPAAKIAVGCLGAVILANCLRSRKWSIFEMALFAFAWYSAFDHVRFLFMAAVLTTPILAVEMERLLFLESDKKTIPVMNMLMVAGAIAFIVHFFPTDKSMQKGMSEIFPMKTIASIQPSWRTLNDDGLGGIMDLEGKPTFIDSRFDTFEHHGVFRDFLDIIFIRNTYANLDKYRIDHVLVNAKSSIAYMLLHHPGWKLARTEGAGDRSYDLIVRSTAGNANCMPATQGQPTASVSDTGRH